MTVIDVKEHPSGVIETPGFPDKFPLPLRCAWIFNKTGLLEDERTSGQTNWIHLYFTQVLLASQLMIFVRLPGIPQQRRGILATPAESMASLGFAWPLHIQQQRHVCKQLLRIFSTT